MAKANINSLIDNDGQPLGIEPISLNNAVVPNEADSVRIIQHPFGGEKCDSSYLCVYIDCK